MKKITLIIKIFIFLFFTCIIVNISFYAYAFITPKFQINTSKNITFYDKDNNDILKDNIENDYVELSNINEEDEGDYYDTIDDMDDDDSDDDLKDLVIVDEGYDDDSDL